MQSNDWKRIRAHYAALLPKILATPKNDWAADAYAWDNGMLTMTPIESWFWADIRESNSVLYPQYPIGKFVVDFANPVARVAIECDGAIWHTDKAKDEARDQALGAMGWSVYRIVGKSCRVDHDEETGALSDAGKFIRRIRDFHGIQFGA